MQKNDKTVQNDFFSLSQPFPFHWLPCAVVPALYPPIATVLPIILLCIADNSIMPFTAGPTLSSPFRKIPCPYYFRIPVSHQQ